MPVSSRRASVSVTSSAIPTPDHREKKKQMGKIALSQNTSLDGVMQSPGPEDVPFKYRGWAVDFDGGPEGARFD